MRVPPPRTVSVAPGGVRHASTSCSASTAAPRSPASIVPPPASPQHPFLRPNLQVYELSNLVFSCHRPGSPWSRNGATRSSPGAPAVNNRTRKAAGAPLPMPPVLEQGSTRMDCVLLKLLCRGGGWLCGRGQLQGDIAFTWGLCGECGWRWA